MYGQLYVYLKIKKKIIDCSHSLLGIHGILKYYT